jgi:hypothetical protein
MLAQIARFHLDDRLLLKFAAQEFFDHGYFEETTEIFSRTGQMFVNDPQMVALFQEATRRTSLSPVPAEMSKQQPSYF